MYDTPTVKSPKKKGSEMNQYEKRFKVLDEVPIGTGSFGRTFIGIDLKRNQKVAIKVVSLKILL